MKILVVDDNHDNVDLVTDILEGDYDMIKAYDGPSCLELARTVEPDLILLDVQMPGMTGFDVIKKLRMEAVTSEIPVIFLTAHYLDTDRIVLGLELGAFDYLTKPIDDEILQAKINVIARIKRAEDAVKNQKAELEEKNLQLIEADRVKSEFLAIMSHEIRTPINGILGYADLLVDTALNENQSEYVNIIETSGRNLLDLINNILDYSKFESGGVDLDVAPFVLDHLVVEALELFMVKAKEKKLELSYELKSGAEGVFLGDVHRIRQVLLNLVNNAVKFTDKGSVKVTVDTKKTEEDGRWELAFAISDTGIGIPEEKRERLFKAFSQVDSSTTRRHGGTGLGLVICKRIVERMGGEISVRSEEGKGSEFLFTITVDAADEA
jgi:signal transduction histidine kinase